MSEWREVQLGEIFDISSSKRVFQEDWKTSGVPFYRAREIVKLAKAGAVLNELFISEELYEKYRSNYGVPKPGDLMVSAVGTLGACYAVQPTDRFYYKDASVLRFSPKQQVCSKFIQHAFHTPEILDQIHAASGSTVGTYTIQRANKTRIRLPPLPEQIRIAAILDQADALRAKRREALAQLDSLAQSIFIEMFGDPGANPKQWSIQPLSALIKGKPNNGIFKKNDEYGDGLPVVWVGELFKDNGINCSNSQRLVPSERELEQYGLHHGDVLFCRSSLKLAGIGYNNVYLGESNKALFECHVIRITPDKNKLDPMFLNFVLRMPSQRLKLFKHAKTVTMTTIDQDGLLRVDLPVPPLQLQKLFADKLISIERLKAVHVKAQVELDTLFGSLQHRAFRGEL